jgi:dihydroneopterin aldolase
MTVTVELAGLELLGQHGALEEERRDGQRFLLDLWLDVPAEAAHTDRLEDAVDYREVVAVVREVSDGRTFTLLEALAAAVADALLARFPVERVRVRVRKPEVRLAAPVDYAAVSVERARSSA